MSTRAITVVTMLAVAPLGFFWGFMRLPPWAMAPLLLGLAWVAAWQMTAQYDHDRPALIGAFIVLTLVYAVAAYIPDLILSSVL
ncbi:MAG TPA: hypothetical protein VGI95_10535 [Caulobacteraceae bacterium]|jgi:hypothetical protein